MNKISKEEFISRIDKIHSATSIEGNEYNEIHICKPALKYIEGTRSSTGKSFKIQINKLYEAYYKLDIINTVTLKKYVARVQSPAMAILIKAGLV